MGDGAAQLDRRLQVREAIPADRDEIYRTRHAVYAAELHQHQVRPDRRLTDNLDGGNFYLVARRGGRLAGFISITPPTLGRYSIDKYLPRDTLPFSVDGALYEIRLLTVMPGERKQSAALVLMYAALRTVESSGGTRVVAIGRREVLDLYRKVGLQTLGRTFKSGAVEFELMTATVKDLRAKADRNRAMYDRLLDRCEWALPMPRMPLAPCFHGGASIRVVGDAFQSINQRGQMVNADVLDAPFDPSPKVLTALNAEALPWLMRTSPPADSAPLVRAIAAARGVPTECIVPAGGSSDLIFRAFTRWITPASRVLLPEPTYGEYAHVLQRVIGCRVDRLQLDRASDYRLDLSQLSEAIHRRAYDWLVLVNPNSPTGQHTPRVELADCLARLPSHTRVWIDETYIDYVGSDESMERAAVERERVIVCKSMSKIYALSGMRVGYACGSATMMADLRSVTPPWVVGLPAQIAAVAAMNDPQWYADRWAEVHQCRNELATQLAEAGMLVLPSVANFLLVFLPSGGPTAAEVIECCQSHGVYLRNAGEGNPSLGKHAIRIAVKNASDNRHILKILKRAME